MKTVVIIPARYESSRFPGKPLAHILDKPMIIWVAEVASLAVPKDHVFVATDDERIANLVKNHGYQYIMTGENCLTGTDRVAEAAKQINADIYINLQGDEPLVNPIDIKKIISTKEHNFDFVVNAYCEMDSDEDPNDPKIPKVIFNSSKEMIYISRKAIPGSKNNLQINPHLYKQVCIYAFNKEELDKFYSYGKKSLIEDIEDIEIIRFFELNKKILMVESRQTLAVDFPDDIEKIEDFLLSKK